jgi:RimJ/RimL family protein N-acetyltransferase
VREIETERLRLRRWRDEDAGPWAALNADPEVMAHFPAPLSRLESDQAMAQMRRDIDERGFGAWVLEVPGVAPFAGMVGLNAPTFEAAFTPCVEVAYRLAREHWGQGYATEAARAALDFGFDDLELTEIVAFTVAANRRSRAVMERLGMRRAEVDDFDHPRLPEGHPLRRHVLYRLSRAGRG